ncbi:MAG: TAXI family TRAP transporter solute-binding subunit [Xanthobacteraceae bacterium]
MPPNPGQMALKFSLRTLLARWLRRNRGGDVEKEPSKSISSRQNVISTQGIDLDAIEEMMNRRLRMIWVRHTGFVITIAFLLLVALTVFAFYLTTEATVLRVAVGPAGSDDVKFVQELGARMTAEKVPFKIVPVIESGPVEVTDLRGKKSDFDLAVVRGNQKLSTDWPVIAILRQDVVALLVPAAAGRAAAKDKAPAKASKDSDKEAATKDKDAAAKDKDGKDKKPAKPGKIEKVSDLDGKRVGIVIGTDGGQDVLNTILTHYGVPRESVTVSNITLADLPAAVHNNKVDAVLVAGPQAGKLIENTIVALTQGKKSPSVIAIDQAEGIGKRVPPYDSLDVPAGALGGVPPVPDDETKSLTFPLYLVARKNFSSDKIAAFSKALYTSRQALAYALPGTVALESPSTDKDAPALVHPGTADYLGDNTKSFFDKYGDWIFYGLLVGPIFGSGLVGVMGYFRADKNTRRVRQLHRLLQLVRKARTVTSIDELDNLQDEADAILGETIQLAERGQLDETGLATFTLAIDQARAALSEQRSVLVLNPDHVPKHRLLPRAGQAAE